MTENYSSRATQLQSQVNGTVGVMRENINKVMDRGVHLDTLQNDTSSLKDSAQLFRRGANRKRKEMWWKEMKLKLCLFAFIIIVVVVLVIVSIIEIKKAS